MEQVLAKVDIQGAEEFCQPNEQFILGMPVVLEGQPPTAPGGVTLPFEDVEGVRAEKRSPETEEDHILCSLSVTGSGDGSPASEPVTSVVEEQVETEISVDNITAAEGDLTLLVMAEAKDAKAMATASGDVVGIVVEDTAVVVDSGGSGPVKRKRGRPRKYPEAQAALPVKKKEHEDVCFVCFDRTNHNIVFCNRRGCYKAYHPVCVSRDEDFFRSKGKWNCGWHICSICQKVAHYLCYTCTTSYCKVCINGESKYVSVRGTYGFCQSCHNTVTLIELNKLACEKKDGLNIVDTDSFTYLFKAYWLGLKGKLSMTSEELNNARHPFFVAESESSDELYDANADHGSSSESSSGDREGNTSSKKRGKGFSHNNFSKEIDVGRTSVSQETGWATKELLELVAHMRNGDQSFVSQFDVQALLLEYIKKYNLRDPRRKSQIVCDLRLQNLFGKPRVGHFEMLKLLESHFLAVEKVQVVADGIQVEPSYPDYRLTDDGEDGDLLARVGFQKKRKNRKRTEQEMQSNVDDYAAVDVHNITLIFLRRSLVEELLDDIKSFNDNVVGSFVKIKISNAGQRQDLYRLVQVVGTHESSKPYKVGKKTTDIMLEILNLDKKETSSIDSISNQDFTEEECQRLRQSIKCGLINRLKVGYIQEKAMVLHSVRVNDLLESEKLRFNHLRDRASETGRRKELRECVEKLQLLNSPEERRRRLTEVPEIHADPKMDPEYQSSEGEEDNAYQDYHLRAKEDAYRKKEKEPNFHGRLGQTGNNWSGMQKSPNSRWERGARMQSEVRKDRFDMYDSSTERLNEFSQNHVKGMPKIQVGLTELQSPRSLGQLHTATPETNMQTLGINFPSVPYEEEKIWHYQDPSKNIQGPFSLAQLRKWNATGYFPSYLRIWRTSQKMVYSQFLTDVLSGSCNIEPQVQVTQHSIITHQSTWTDSLPSRHNWDSNQNASLPAPDNIKLPAVDQLPSLSSAWSKPRMEISNSEGMPNVYSSTWSSNPTSAAAINNNHCDKSTLETGCLGVGGASGWNRKEDNGNTWSPMRPMSGKSGDIPEYGHLSSAVPAVPGSFNANTMYEVKSKYGIIESECPSPTPRGEMKESPLLHHDGVDTANKLSDMLDRPAVPTTTLHVGNLDANHGLVVPAFQAIGFSSTNAALAEGNLSPVASSADDKRLSTFGSVQGQMLELSSQKPEFAKQEMSQDSVLHISNGPNLAPPQLPAVLDHDQTQRRKINLPSISQVNPQHVSSLECSLPSPTPRSNKNAASTSENQSLVNVQTVEHNNSCWAVPGNTGWGMPARGQANADRGWGAPVQGSADENNGWEGSAQLGANGFAASGAPVPWNGNSSATWGAAFHGKTNAGTSCGTSVHGNSNSHTGWGAMPLDNADVNSNIGNGCDAPLKTNITSPCWGTGTTMEAIPRREGDANRSVGWCSSLGSSDGGWKSSDTARWRGNNEGNNAKWYLHHREGDAGRCGRGCSFQPRRVSPGANGRRGVCKFYENGHCKKGRLCKYLHI